MLLPRAGSDPGAQRRDPIWREAYPPLPNQHTMKASRIPAYGPQVIYDEMSSPQLSPHLARQMEMRSIGVNTCDPGSIPYTSTPSPKRRESCLLTILLAPFRAIQWILKQWCAPSSDCMHCVTVTNWIVMTISGLASIIVTVSPMM